MKQCEVREKFRELGQRAQCSVQHHKVRLVAKCAVAMFHLLTLQQQQYFSCGNSSGNGTGNVRMRLVFTAFYGLITTQKKPFCQLRLKLSNFISCCSKDEAATRTQQSHEQEEEKNKKYVEVFTLLSLSKM